MRLSLLALPPAAALLLAATAPRLAAQDVCGVFEAVEPGDTFATISDRCGVGIDLLQTANPDVDGSALDPGSVVSLQAATADGAAPIAPSPNIIEAPDSEDETDESTSATGAGDAPASDGETEGGDDIDVVGTEPPEATEEAMDAYEDAFLGLWRLPEGECNDVDQTWAFGTDSMRIGGRVFDLLTVERNDAGVTLGVLARTQGETPSDVILEVSGTEEASATAAGVVQELVLCARTG